MKLLLVIGVAGATVAQAACGASGSSSGGGIDAYEQCILNSMTAAAQRIKAQGKTYQTLDEATVVAMVRRNAELECAGK